MANGHNRLRDIYSDHIDNDILFGIEINSREELQEMEKEEFGEVGRCINWIKWDSLVEKTKEELENYKRSKYKHSRIGTHIYAYDINNGELIKAFASGKQAAEHFNVAPYTIVYYAKMEKPFNNEVIFSLKPLERDELTKYKPTWIYAFRLDTNELLGKFRTPSEASKAFGLPSSKVSFLLTMQNGIFKKANLRFSYKNDRIIM